MRIALAISALVCGLAATSFTFDDSAPALPDENPFAERKVESHCRHARKAVPFYRQLTWSVQSRWLSDRADRTPLVRGKSCAWARYAADEWVGRARNALRSHTRYLQEVRAEARRLYEKWRCIHEHEGAWDDPNGPYWGGLQMDMGFQQAYGPEFLARWGTADNWPVWAQIEAAERAYESRGFDPWPTYQRYCA